MKSSLPGSRPADRAPGRHGGFWTGGLFVAMPSPLVITIHRNGAYFRENPRRGSPDNLAGTAARQPRRLSDAMTEPGGHCTEHWHAARRGTKLLGRHGTQASNSIQTPD